MKTYGLIGFPLTHSFSKKYFTAKFEKEGILDTVYCNFGISSVDELPGLLKADPSLKGFNITIPYKEQVLKYADHLSEEVKETGAANCIKIAGGKLSAYNTDIPGFERSFIKKLRAHHKKALILGSGGSSKAVQYVLKKLGIGFLTVSRNETKTVNAVSYDQLTKQILDEFTVIINCTPVGMFPNESSYPDIPYSCLTAKHYLFDLVYNPVKTLFLKKGEERGASIENGYEMLVLQAEESWRIWNED